ncbi:MAG TPA: DUF2971 domain-containing protein [Desulfatiglandales bacterium]|nr:DUF2971 domain-containing protein [Desulfatiglandales bacterium]
MILYKYYSYDAGIAALKDGKLVFRRPSKFNDPFEFTLLSNSRGMKQIISGLKESVVVLSLTRIHDNPLMWAHYGQEHTGFVIGYKVEDPFLKSKKYNIIPVDQGDVVYTSTKPPPYFSDHELKRIHNAYLIGHGLDLNSLKVVEQYEVENLLRRMLLTKHSSWVYEEEVRVVKVLQSLFSTAEEYQADPFRRFSSITCDVAPYYRCEVIEGLYLYHNEVKIKEVYLGIRNPLLASDRKNKSSGKTDSSLVDRAVDKNWIIKGMTMANKSWGLKSIPLNPKKLTLTEKEIGLLNRFSFGAIEANFLKQKFSQINIEASDNFELTNWSGNHI